MVGSPDGSKEIAKTDLSGMWVDTGKPESRESGIDAQIYLARLVKAPTPLKIPDF